MCSGMYFDGECLQAVGFAVPMASLASFAVSNVWADPVISRRICLFTL